MNRTSLIQLMIVLAIAAAAILRVGEFHDSRPPPGVRSEVKRVHPPEAPALAPAPPAGGQLAPQSASGGKYCADDGDESFVIRHTLGYWVETHDEDGRLRDLVVAARTARDAGDLTTYRESIRLAYLTLPNDPSISWAAADAFRHSAEPGFAAGAIGSYLSVMGTVPPLARLKARLEVEAEIVRNYKRVDAEGVTLLWPSDELSQAEADELLRRTRALLDEAALVVGRPRRSTLTVVLTPGREEILAVTCVRDWAEAVYDGKLRIAVDRSTNGLVSDGVLRHEVLHAVMDDVLKGAPLWLNEGMAQWFAHEQPRVKKPWKLMYDNGTYIPFASLDGSFQAFEASEDASLAYAQSLLMVQWIVDLGGDGALAKAVRLFRDGNDTTRVLDGLVGSSSGDELIKHLRSKGDPTKAPDEESKP